MVKSGITAALLATVCGVQAGIVTNDFFGDISSPTTLSGVTNIIAKSGTVNVTANLTLDNKTFLWLQGDKPAGYLNLAPTSNDVTLEIKNGSGLYLAYRYSCDGNNANTDWAKVGIDQLNKNEVAGYYNARLGVEGGAPGSTGRVRILPQNAPAFGYNAISPFWPRYLYIETSVSPDPASGMIDFVEIPKDVTLDIGHIIQRSTAYPARVQFKGGSLRRNNACRVGYSNLAPQAGTTLILEGVGGNEVWLRAQFLNPNQLTQREGGTVRFIGTNVKLQYTGNTPYGTGRNHYPWQLAAADNVSWEHTGTLTLSDTTWLQVHNDDLLPHGATKGGLNFGSNSYSESTSRSSVTYSALDLYGTRQLVNGVTSGSTESWRIGVITNTHATAKGTLVLGTDDLSGQFTAKATANVVIEKVGSGGLTITKASGEQLDVKAGMVMFGQDNVFTNVTAEAGTMLSGALEVRSSLVVGTDVEAVALNLALDAGANISCMGRLEIFNLSVAGSPVAPGIYEAATTGWLTEGTVVVLRRAGDSVADIDWTGNGEAESTSLAANWSDGKGAFTVPRGRPVFATSGVQAMLDGGVSHFMGMKFDAAGDFAVVTNGPTDAISLYGSLDVTVPNGNAARTYTVAAPIKLYADQVVTLTTNMSVRLSGGLSSSAGFGITLQGVQNTASGMMFDYSDGTATADDKLRSGGELILENARVSGPITHRKGGGWLVLRGDVGNPGDTAALDLDYVRYRDNKSTANGLMFGGLTRLENATIWKPVSISGQGQVGGIADRWFVAAPNTTNVFKELVTCGPSTALVGQKYTRMVYEKGVYVSGGGFNPRSLNTSSAADAATHVFNGPVRMDSTSRQLCPNSEARLVFNSTGNYSKLFVQSQHAVFEFNVDDAWDNTGFILDGDRARLELGTTHQKMPWLISGMINNTNPQWFADNAAKRARGTVNGTYPSALEITWGAPTESACAVTNCGVKFTGWVKLEKSGDGFLEMLPLAHTSYGDVEVSGGTLAFDAGASWLNGTNVTVKGTGTLKLGSAGTFQDDSKVYAEGENWTLDLTGNQKVCEFHVDGRKMPGGVYGASSLAANHPLKSHFVGTGALLVRETGTLLLFR